MEIKIRADQVELTDKLKEHVDNEFRDLEKFFDEDEQDEVRLDVRFHKNSSHKKAGDRVTLQLNLRMPKDNIRFERSYSGPFEAVDVAEEKIQELVVKHNEKIRDNRRDNLREIKNKRQGKSE